MLSFHVTYLDVSFHRPWPVQEAIKWELRPDTETYEVGSKGGEYALIILGPFCFSLSLFLSICLSLGSVHRQTSTASSGRQCSPPDLNRHLQFLSAYRLNEHT